MKLYRMEEHEIDLLAKRRINKRGSEALTVYNIIYIPACSRSGWYPQPKININVGINDASNIK